MAIKLCECGCRKPAPIADRTDPSRGYVKGKPLHFIWRHGKKVAPEKRFWQHVNKGGPLPSVEAVAVHPDIAGKPCWLWTASTNGKGYGQFSIDGIERPAHRVAWLLTYGSWPKPCGLHKCDNRLCVCPEHLFEGTMRENAQDMVRKGRCNPPSNSGEEHNMAKLTNKQVRQIRKLSAQGWTQCALADKFNSVQTNISLILSGKTWRCVL